MSYFDINTNELMLDVLDRYEYSCLPLSECIEDNDIIDKITMYVKKLFIENNKNKEMIEILLNNVKELENDNNNLCKENGILLDKINKSNKNELYNDTSIDFFEEEV